MEITTQELDQIELITVTGRVDSVEAPRLAQALEDANRRGRYKIIVDMSQLEYMSSAGFRALATAQRNSRRHERGDVLLVQVPDQVREALELVGFTNHFNIFEDVTSALEHARDLSAGGSATGAQSLPAEKQ
ncbi:MAG TPA: STAS domain-containing protein [Anaerolineales bacterium]|nr:STAS domain-containing protein [Anaerolineales bacterium]